MYALYSFLLTAAAILGAPYWLFKGLREKKYLQSFRQRLGSKGPALPLGTRPVWVHAVSVGEVLAARPVVAAIQQVRPELPVVLSTVTPAGQALALKEFPAAAAVFYFPFDWHFCVARFLSSVNPRAVLLVEKELWPNFLDACFRRGVPVFLVNGRISEQSFNRYRRIKSFTAGMLRQLRVIGAQTHEDRKRFLQLGAGEDQVRVTGNVKFDFQCHSVEEKSDVLEKIRSSLAVSADTPVVVVGSSMKGEESLFIEAFRRVREAIPDVKLILAPRHPERFDEVAQLLERCSISFLRRTGLCDNSPGGRARVLLLDSIGELRAVYSLATVAVIGGSFLPHGGHNLLEPAAFGKAIVFGPEMSNFTEMARLFVRGQAARQTNAESLPRTLLELLRNPEARNLLGHRALSTLRQNQGATQSSVDCILASLP